MTTMTTGWGVVWPAVEAGTRGGSGFLRRAPVLGLAVLVALGWGSVLPGPVAGQSTSPSAEGGDGGSAEGQRITFPVAELSGGEVKVDGVLDEAAWRTSRPIPLPYEAHPGDNTPAPVDTRCFVTFDHRALHLACRALDPGPEAIRAYITDRDEIEGHDRIVFTLDPFNDRRRAFRFGISALGVQYDALFDGQATRGGSPMGGPEDPSWDAIWSSAARLTDEGYAVEASIPFKSLRFPSSSGVQTWGFYVSRFWPRSERVEVRSMAWDRDDSCELCQANLLRGFRGISPGTNLELTPTLTGNRTDPGSGNSPGELEAGPVTGELGLDARWGITPNLTLNATANPDFSQVEADVAQLDVNNRFALFFPEKRPFFLEGADFFATPVQALFTRSIADPSVGAKLTGKAGANGLGLLVARDEVNNLLFPGNQGSSTATLEEGVTTATARFRRDLGGSSALGGIYVGREGEDGYYNRVGGVDAFIRLRPALTARLQYLHTETRYAPEVSEAHDQPGGSFGGDAATLMLRYDTRDWFGALNLQSRSAGFRADAGFVPRVDWRDVGAWLNRSFWADDASWYTRLVWAGGAWHQENQAGRLSNEGIWTNLRYEGPRQSSLWVNPNLQREFFDGREHAFVQTRFGASIQPSGTVSLQVNGNLGGVVDLANSREGRQIQLSPSLTLRLGRRVNLRLTRSVQDLNTLDGREVFRADISRVRAVYNFSPRAFVRAVLQYRDIRRKPENWVDPDVDPRSQELSSQLLFSYKVNPRTVLFLGYSDNRARSDDLDLGQSDGLTLSGRTLFVKLGWAFRP